MKFLADMGISPRVVSSLRERGHEAIHLQEEGLGRMPDSELLAASGGNLPSVIIFRLRDMRAENVKSHLFSILEKQSDALEKGVVCSVTERKVPIRALPI